MRAYRTRARAKNGFVLVVVLWGIGLISLLALAVIKNADTYAKIVANNIEAARVEALSEAGTNIAILGLLGARGSQTRQPNFNGKPVFCRLPDAVAALDIENEGGKVDLNAAPSNLLAALFKGVGASEEEAANIAASIVDFRGASNAELSRTAKTISVSDQDNPPPKHSLFESTLELEQIPGITPSLFQAIAPYVTVYGHSPGIDPNAASPALLGVLGQSSATANSALTENQRMTTIPPEFVATSNSNSFLVRAEIVGLHHTVFVRESILEFPYDNPKNIQIREWRRAEKRFASRLESMSEHADIPPC